MRNYGLFFTKFIYKHYYFTYKLTLFTDIFYIVYYYRKYKICDSFAI